MASTKKTKTKSETTFGAVLAIEQLTGLAAELQRIRYHPPLVKRQDGKYEGAILGFVKGLRLSARVIYFLRERLSQTGLQVSWGHLLDSNEQSCSPECDVIIHTAGHVREWNGSKSPVMEFKFIEATSVRAVVSCKSNLNTIDKAYPKALSKYGVKDVFLFAECCHENRFSRLRETAKQAGYRGLWCLYFTKSGEPSFKTDESIYVEFAKEVLRSVK